MDEFYRYHLFGVIALGPAGQWDRRSLRFPWRFLGRMRPIGNEQQGASDA